MDRRRILKTAGVAALAVLGGWLGLWLLGPVLLPFGVGYLFALGAQPAVDTLTKRHIPRWAAAGLTVTLLYAALGTALYALGWVLCRETLALARQLPELAESLTGPAARVEAWLLERADRFPDGVGQALRQGVEEFFRSGAGLAGRAYNWVFGLISGALKKLPELRELWRRKAPALWQRRVQAVNRRLRATLGGWVKTQVQLMGVTALVLTAGLLVLGVDYPVLLGGLIALIDALPVFGSGTVLLPWALWELLDGRTTLAVGLAALYAGASLIRSALEPRMLGKQMGLDPLLTLLALYAGFRYFGILGMILFPVGAILVKQLWTHLESNS